ncbi:MAG: site-specific integrase, partial [Myxococcaceae bacterium]
AVPDVVAPPTSLVQVERPIRSVLFGLVRKSKADPDTLTFGEAVEVWRKLGARRLKATTVVGYTKNLSTYLLPWFRDMRMLDLDRATLAPFEMELVEAGLSDRSRNNILITRRSIVRFVCDLTDWKVPRWPKLLPIKIKHYDPPTREEVQKLLDAAPAPDTKLAIALASYAGLRAGEVRGLRPIDVDLGRGTLTVRQTLYQGKADTPKSGHERQIPLAPVLHRLLEEASHTWTGSTERVTAAREKPRWSTQALRHAFLTTFRRAGLPPHRFHGLRHFFISFCFEGGADAPTVQKLAGHCHLSVTQRYAHTQDHRLRQAVQVFG